MLERNSLPAACQTGLDWSDIFAPTPHNTPVTSVVDEKSGGAVNGLGTPMGSIPEEEEVARCLRSFCAFKV
jgi:hypothetical protein